MAAHHSRRSQEDGRKLNWIHLLPARCFLVYFSRGRERWARLVLGIEFKFTCGAILPPQWSNELRLHDAGNQKAPPEAALTLDWARANRPASPSRFLPFGCTKSGASERRRQELEPFYRTSRPCLRVFSQRVGVRLVCRLLAVFKFAPYASKCDK